MSDTIRSLTDPNRIHPVLFTAMLIMAVLLAGGCASTKEPTSYRSMKAHVMNEQGIINYRKGDLQNALLSFQKALDHAEATDNQTEAVRAHINIGGILCEQNLVDQACPHFDKAFQIAEDLDDDALHFSALEAMGGYLFRKERYEEAAAMLHEALDLAEELDDSGKQALTLNDLGSVYQKLGQTEDALKCFHESIYLYENLEGFESLEGRSSVYINTSEIRKAQGKFAEAWDLLTSALACQEKIGNSETLVTCHINMAELLEAWGKPSDALLRYERAFGVAKQALNRRWMEICMENILRLTQALGMKDLYMKYQKIADELRRQFHGKSLPP
ncbi:MAG: tetratricopeptide repeat protein [Planctomycetota bacterium]